MIAAVISMPNKCIITLFRKNASFFCRISCIFKIAYFSRFYRFFQFSSCRTTSKNRKNLVFLFKFCRIYFILFHKEKDALFQTSFSIFYQILARACSISAMISSASSMPTDKRIKSGATPASRSCSSVS